MSLIIKPYHTFMLKILAALTISLVPQQYVLSAQAPNIVLVITDDQGYGDLSFHGNSLVSTPAIDAIAKSSVRFNDFHVDPTCAPTRGALMTGKYAHRVNVWHTISGGNHLRASETTMADVFKQAGYQTALFGKWHLGSNYPYRPMDRGFDEWLGQGDGGTGTTDDWFDNDRVNDYYWHNGERVQRKGFATDVFFDAAINFIEKKQHQPFFVKLSTYLPHSPHTLPNSRLKDKFTGKVNSYIAQFFASVERIDWNIAKLETALKKAGLYDNTIFIFMTDNGGASSVPFFNAGMRGQKGSVYEGGHRVPFFIRWPAGNLAHNQEVESLTSHIDVLPSLIALTGIKSGKDIDFDGRSFLPQLTAPKTALPERVLFVETQRTLKTTPWENTAGMYKHWRLIDNTALYNLAKDPAQQQNVIDQQPDILAKIRQAHKTYWNKVTVNERSPAVTIVGHENDPETFLHAADWHIDDAPWNHAQLASGSNKAGAWYIDVASDGIYRFEARRWPREANTAIQGIPILNKKIDAWNEYKAITHLIYGDKLAALSVASITLDIAPIGTKKTVKALSSQTKSVSQDDKKIIFELPLSKGKKQVGGLMLDQKEQPIAGIYYLYVTKVSDLPLGG